MNLRTSSRLLLTFASVLALSASACSSNDDEMEMAKPKDDGKAPGATLDAGVAPDSGVAPRADAGTTTGGGRPQQCDPITGSGCTGMDEFCTLAPTGNSGMCRAVSEPKAFEAPCDAQAQDCGPGMLCGQFQGETGTTCKKLCSAETGVGCETATGASETYVCAYQLTGSDQYAVCGGVELCLPQDANSCPAGQTCSLVDAMGKTGCLDSGTATLGADCGGTGNCVPGLICVNIGGGAKCYDACDPLNPAAPGCTEASSSCLSLSDLEWGLCVENECAPETNPCPAGQTCDASGGGTVCEPAGTTPFGGSCAQSSCTADAVCVAVDASGPRCFETCTMTDPTCSAGQCALAQQGDFGVCVR